MQCIEMLRNGFHKPRRVSRGVKVRLEELRVASERPDGRYGLLGDRRRPVANVLSRARKLTGNRLADLMAMVYADNGEITLYRIVDDDPERVRFLVSSKKTCWRLPAACMTGR